MAAPWAYAGTVTPLKTFEESSSGTYPSGAAPTAMSIDAVGNLYGGTALGGKYGGGVLYTIDTSGSYKILHSIDTATDGGGPVGAPIIRAGTLYDNGAGGGSSDAGTVFSMRTNGRTFTVLHHFSGPDGSGPIGSLALGADRTIYGTTFRGGSAGYGVLYKLAPDGTYTILYQFTVASQTPTGVVIDDHGNLFGATQYSIFEYSAGGVYTTLYTETDSQETPLTVSGVDAGGNVYGYAAGPGGNYPEAGYLFELVKTGARHIFQKLVTLSKGTTGAQPVGLHVNADGSLIGATRYGIETGGKTRDGTLFSFANGTYTTLFEFDLTAGAPLADGRLPSAAPVVNTAGTVFGPTENGGDKRCSISSPPPNGCGVIYQYTP